MTLSNKTYDTLKWVALVALPAVGAFYVAMAKVWGLPYSAEVAGTVAAVDALLGTLLGLSSAAYKGDGTIKIDSTSEEKDVYLLEMNIPVEDIKNCNTVTLKVDPNAVLKS